jgi:hypothetical protein
VRRASRASCPWPIGEENHDAVLRRPALDARLLRSRTIAELKREASFYRVTYAGVREAHPHDIKIIKEAPNYRS